MAEGTVRVPGIGQVKRQQVYIGVALVAGIAGYAWWRAGSGGAPAEDIPAYTEEDIADGVTDTPVGTAGPGANSGGADTDSSTTPDTDAEWTQQATELLSAAAGIEGGAASVALGRYITHQSLTPAQADIVRAAIGLVGYPPGGAYPINTSTGSTPSALTEPKGLKKTGATSSTVSLEWSPVAGAAGYRVYRSDVATNVGASVDTKITIGGLTPSKGYRWHVRAVDDSGKLGPRSATITAGTTDAKLSAPKNLRARATGRDKVELTWSAVSGATEYRAYRKGVTQNVGVSHDTRMTIGGLRGNTTYYFKIAANAGNGPNGPSSSWARVKTPK